VYIIYIFHPTDTILCSYASYAAHNATDTQKAYANLLAECIDWLSMVLRLHQHNIGYTADGFYRSDDPTNSVIALKEGG